MTVTAEVAAEYLGAFGSLWVPPEPVTWHPGHAGYRATVEVEGGPDAASCRLIVQAPPRPWPSGGLSLLWRDERVRGFDLDGPRHIDPRGRSVAPPHRQSYTAQGREVVEAVDLAAEGIDRLEAAIRWFAAWCGVEWRAGWVDPPIQVNLPGLGQRPRRGTRHR